MCGIAGFIRPGGGQWADLVRVARGMARTLRHRGPDDAGAWADENCGVAFAFQRLAIIDLSEHGRQPMASGSGRYMIVFNGEIYNFQELRVELEAQGVRFRGHSDTEVALGVIERHGIEAALKSFNGMFALALWDRETRELVLARDRFGEKPLYYGWAGRSFVFGSELKALEVHPEFNAEIDREALQSYFEFGYVPSPQSIYTNICKLPPGSFVTVSGDAPGDQHQAQPYWSAQAIAAQGLESSRLTSEEEAAGQLDALLRRAVRLRMVADVPVGAFLSGGMDSSIIVALMQAQTTRPVRTFSIGFNEAAYDEADAAKQVANALRTDHTELRVSPREAQSVIPDLATVYDEPFADSSQIPTILVASLARKHVTVALTGDGGDELFGGYRRYVWTKQLWEHMARMPRLLRSTAGRGLRSLSPDTWEGLAGFIRPMIPRRRRVQNVGEKLHRLSGAVGVSSAQNLYEHLVAVWPEPSRLLVAAASSSPRASYEPHNFASADLRDWMMLRDSVTYLPDDILTKVDRATMATSLEARVPFLDPDVHEFAWRLPMSMKFRGNAGKWLLRRVLHRYVEPSLIERPKMGFGVPIGSWLRGPLRAWAAELLDPKRLRREGFIRPELVASMWAQHNAGRTNWQYRLWSVLMFQAWLEQHQRSGRAVTAAVS